MLPLSPLVPSNFIGYFDLHLATKWRQWSHWNGTIDQQWWSSWAPMVMIILIGANGAGVRHWRQWIAISIIFCRHWRQWREFQIVYRNLCYEFFHRWHNSKNKLDHKFNVQRNWCGQFCSGLWLWDALGFLKHSGIKFNSNRHCFLCWAVFSSIMPKSDSPKSSLSFERRLPNKVKLFVVASGVTQSGQSKGRFASLRLMSSSRPPLTK